MVNILMLTLSINTDFLHFLPHILYHFVRCSGKCLCWQERGIHTRTLIKSLNRISAHIIGRLIEKFEKDKNNTMKIMSD